MGNNDDKQDLIFSVKLQLDFSVLVLVVLVLVVFVTGKIMSTPSPKTEVLTWDWSLTINYTE